MNVAEILRALADKISSVEQDVPHQDQSAELHAVDVGNDEHPEVNTDSIMVAPLQKKLELMKKMAGEESYYDDHGCGECGCDPCECDHGHADEMEIMKRNAGIAPAAATLIVADEDEPFEG
jgi:hypothetical protein